MVKLIAVGPVRPQLMIPGDKEPGTGEAESRKALLKLIPIGRGSIANDQQHIAARAIHLIDQVDRARL